VCSPFLSEEESTWGQNSKIFAQLIMSENESPAPNDNECVEDDVFAQIYDDSDTDGVYQSVCEVDLREELEKLDRHNVLLQQLADRVKRIQNDIELRQVWAEDSRTKILPLRQEVILEK